MADVTPVNGPNAAPKPANAPVQPAAPVAAPVVKSDVDTSKLRPQLSRSFADADFVPSRWIIVETGEDRVRAENNATGNVFEGSIAEFNLALRGKLKAE